MGFQLTSDKASNEAQIQVPDPDAVEDYVKRATVPKTRKQRILSLVWDTFNKDPETRAYVNRLDRIFFLYSMYMYFVKYLDQSNVSNAYVSGMQEDVSFFMSNIMNS